MKVSLITVSFNSDKYIRDCIKSVINQKYKNIQYIIIDGKSTDNTMQIIKEYEQYIDILISESDGGIYDAMNKGLKNSSGDLIGFINSDDFYPSDDVIGLVVDKITQTNSDICFGDLCYIKPLSKKISRYWKSNQFKKGSFKKSWAPPHPTFFVKKIIFDKYGHFDLRYKLAADFDLMSRFLELHNVKVSYLSKVMVHMREGGATNKSIKNIIDQNIEILDSLKNNNLNPNIFTFVFFKFFSRLSQIKSVNEKN